MNTAKNIVSIPNMIPNILFAFLSFGVIKTPRNNCCQPNKMNIIGKATLALILFNNNPIGKIRQSIVII